MKVSCGKKLGEEVNDWVRKNFPHAISLEDLEGNYLRKYSSLASFFPQTYQHVDAFTTLTSMDIIMMSTIRVHPSLDWMQ